MRQDNVFRQIILGIPIAVISGIIIAYILQDARFDPTRTIEPTTQPIDSPTPTQVLPTPTSAFGDIAEIEINVTPEFIIIAPHVVIEVTLTPDQLEQKCNWLRDNFPQSADLIALFLSIPKDTRIGLEYMNCPGGSTTVAGAYIQGSTIGDDHSIYTLTVPEKGCIDAYDGQETFAPGEYVQITENIIRIYSGIVYADALAYWPWCDEKRP